MAKKYKQALQNHQIIRTKALVQHQDIKHRLVVLPELEALIPPPKESEFKKLENNILRDGCREALLVWENDAADETSYILIDGHNRYAICQKYQLDFRITLLQFDSMKEVKEYMINNQLGRRNLTREQASFLRGMRYHQEKGEKGKYEREHKPQNGDNDALRTSERLAEEYKVSKNTIERDAEFALGLEKIGEANPALKRDILTGHHKVAKAKIQQLSKITGPLRISSPADIDHLLQTLAAPAKASDTDAEEQSPPVFNQEIMARRQHLYALGQQVQQKSPTPELLDQLIREAQALKELLKSLT